MASSQRKYKVEDFELGEVLGEGAYAKVVRAKLRWGDEFALKIVDKALIVRRKKEHFVMNEKKVLSMLRHEGVVRLYATFQDRNSLYFLLSLASGGELFRQIRTLGRCPENLARHYAAEIVMVLEYLHSNNVIHRDLKPENILLSGDGHVILADYGTAKIVNPSSSEDLNRKASFVGTAEYVSPELLKNNLTGFGVDFWALGCVVFQLLGGRPPFRGETEFLTFQLILNRNFEFPEDIPELAKDLIDRLLTTDVEKRLGCGESGINEIKRHPWFDGIDFESLYSKPPPMFTLPSEPVQNIAEASELELKSTTQEAAVLDADNGAWSGFLLPGESIVFEGIVSKRRGLFAKRRHLLLTSVPRFIYINPSTMQQSGEISWTNELYVEKRSSSVFYIHTGQKSYYIQTKSCTSDNWIAAVRKVKESLVP